MSKRFQVFFLLFLSLSFTLSAQMFITAEEVEKHGVIYRHLQPVNLSHDGKYLVTSEAVDDIKLKAKGVTRILRVLRFKDNKLEKIDSLELPIFHTVNLCVSDARDEMLVLGNYGTKLLKIDLKKMEMQTAFQLEKGKAGFKGGPFLLCHKGNFYATGWFYDEEQFWKGDYLAKMVFKKGEEVKFQKAVSLDGLYGKQDGRILLYHYAAPTQIYFNIAKDKERLTYLKVYRKKQEEIVDKGFQVRSVVGTEDWVFYSIQRKEKEPFEHCIKDFKTGEKFNIGDPKSYYAYPFAKGDILIVIVVQPNVQTFDAYYGTAGNKFQFDMFLSMEEMGPMKVTKDGKIYMLMTRHGIKIGEVKPLISKKSEKPTGS